MRELRLLWLFCVIFTDATAIQGRSVEQNNEAEEDPGSKLVSCSGDRKENIDAAHISRYGKGCMTDSQSLDQFTTLHPSEKSKVVAAAKTNYSSLQSNTSEAGNKSIPVKKLKNKTLQISSGSAQNGGRKGPMSGAKNGDNTFGFPVLIPFPMIPVQGQGAVAGGGAGGGTGGVAGGVAGSAGGGTMGAPAGGGKKNKKKVEKASSDNNKKYNSRRISKKRQNMINTHLIQLVNKQENASADVPTGNVSIERLRRDTTQIEENSLTDEERDLRDKWLHPTEEDLIPGAENNYFNANDVAFIKHSEQNFEKHMAQVWPILKKYKRTLFDDDEDEENLQHYHLRQTRGADDNQLIIEAKRKLAEAERAAEALTNIEIEVGVDPMHLVENTHRYVAKLTNDKNRYDAAIRSHIVEVGAAIRRSMINGTDGNHNEANVLKDINGAKRQLEEDRSKLEEVNTELKELKDIELMAAGLEVAKYVARERALENLAAARSSIERAPGAQTGRIQENIAPPKPEARPQSAFAAPKPAQVQTSTLPFQANTYMYPQYNTATAQYANGYPSKVESFVPPNEQVNPLNVVSPYNGGKTNVGTPDHEITKIEQSHKTEDNKDTNSDSGDSHDWGGMLTFPGTTYSPPPSWLQGQNDPFARQHPHPATQTPSTNANSQAVPYTSSPSSYRPFTPETSTAPIAQPPAAVVTTPQLEQPYSLSEAIASTLRRPGPNDHSAAPPQPKIAYTSDAKNAVATANYIKNQGPITNNVGITSQMNFANPAYSNGAGTSAGEVIRVTPQDETYTIHNARNQNSNQAANAGLPSPTSTNLEASGGTLPGWMGAVDGAKYDVDVSDRLRQQNSQVHLQKGFAPSPEDQVKRGMENLKKAESKYHDVQVASKAVSGIEKAVGLDSASIVKMIDFVKRSAIDDVKQSSDIVNKDISVLNDIKNGIASKKANAGADVNEQRDDVAFVQARMKLKDGEHNLADAKDRLAKIKKMEMLVTGIEVAKYYAAEKAAMEVQGSKRHLQEAIKRTRVPQALISKLSVINKKH